MSQAKGRSDNNEPEKNKKKDIFSIFWDFVNKVVDLVQKIVEIIQQFTTDNPQAAFAILMTIVGGTTITPVVYDGLNSTPKNQESVFPAIQKVQAHEVIQANDSSKQRQETLNSYLRMVQDLFNDEGFSNADRELIKANSFTILRTLDGQGKGYLVRFLDEYGLIKFNQPGFSLSGADLQKIDLRNAWLPDINLQGAYLTGGNLQKTSLKRANLVRANLKNVNLAGTDLTGANLTGADLTGTNLADAVLCNTILPNGTKSDCR